MKKKMILSLGICFLSFGLFSQEHSSYENQEKVKIKQIKKDPVKYIKAGGGINDRLLSEPVKNKPIKLKEFTIHPKNDDIDDLKILNKRTDQSSSEYRKSKARVIEKLEQSKDPRVLSPTKEKYKTPEQRKLILK